MLLDIKIIHERYIGSEAATKELEIGNPYAQHSTEVEAGSFDSQGISNSKILANPVKPISHLVPIYWVSKLFEQVVIPIPLQIYD